MNARDLRASETLKLLQLVLAIVAAVTIAATVSVRLIGLETTRAHQLDIYRLELKLDCALWDLPRGCADTLSPRGIPRTAKR